jgi:hypothetical protein
MSDGYSEFLVFLQVGAVLGAVCIAPVLISHLVGRARGRDGRSAPAPAPSVGELLAPEPDEGWRVRALEHEAVQSRAAGKRASALRELRALGRHDSMTTMLVAVLDSDDHVRHEAARGIATLGDTGAVEPLVHAVASRSRRADGAREAVLGLGPAAVPELQRLERDSDDPELRRAAFDLEQAIA